MAVGARVVEVMAVGLAVGGVGAMAVLGARVVRATAVGLAVGGMGGTAVRARVIRGMTAQATEANAFEKSLMVA